MSLSITVDSVWYTTCHMGAETESQTVENPLRRVDGMTAAGLERIREDGSVLIDFGDGKEDVLPAGDLVDVDALSEFLIREHLHSIAYAIEGAISLQRHTTTDIPVAYLAHSLSPYREHHDFVWKGAGVLRTGPDGQPIGGIDVDRLIRAGLGFQWEV